MNPDIHKGARFLHRRILTPDGSKQLHQITRIAQGWVYYRPVYVQDEKEVLGSPLKAGPEYLLSIVERWVNEEVSA